MTLLGTSYAKPCFRFASAQPTTIERKGGVKVSFDHETEVIPTLRSRKMWRPFIPRTNHIPPPVISALHIRSLMRFHVFIGSWTTTVIHGAD